MKEIIDLLSAKEEKQIHGSTGTVECCSNMLVQGTSDPTTAERKAYWTTVQNITEEASLLFHSLKDSLETESTSEAIFQKVSKQPKFAEDVKHSFRAFLRMEDTGGQPELMDMLPVLTIGPGL